MSVECPKCRTCTDIVNVRRTSSKPSLFTYKGSEFFSVGSDFLIETLPPENTLTQTVCCCYGKKSVIAKIDTYFDFAYSYGNFSGCTNPLLPCQGHPGFTTARCSELSIASEARVTLNLENLSVTNMTVDSTSTGTAKCLNSFVGDVFTYILQDIPKIKGFKLDLLDYLLTCDTDFPEISCPDSWVGDSGSFINATNRYQTGILYCAGRDIEPRINDSLGWLTFGRSQLSLELPLFANYFYRRLDKYSSDGSTSLSYRKKTRSAIVFMDRIPDPNNPKNDDRYFLIQAPVFNVTLVFETNLIKDSSNAWGSPAPELKMWVRLSIEDSLSNVKYELKSNKININNINDINSTFIIQQDVGVYVGSILDPGSTRFVPDPVFHQRPILIEVI